MTRLTTALVLTTISVAVVNGRNYVRIDVPFGGKGGLNPELSRKNKIAQGEMDRWLKEMDVQSATFCNVLQKASWDHNMDLDNTAKIEIYHNAQQAHSKFEKRFMAELEKKKRESEPWMVFNKDTLRQFELLKMESVEAHEESVTNRSREISTVLGGIYGKAEVCRGNETKGTNGNKSKGTKCLGFSPGIRNIMCESHDLAELKWAWQGWRDATGAKVRPYYAELVSLQNQAAQDNDFANAGEFWRKRHFGSDIATIAGRMYAEVKPLYRELFGYVRRKLWDKYGQESGIRLDGPIPAHLFGDMFAGEWRKLLTNGVIQPYPDVPPNDITKEMRRQKYTVRKMFNMSEDFFTSLGLFKMNEGFWKNSMFVKPTDTVVDCMPSAWDFCDGKDFRIRMCTQVNHNSLNTIHHEMGHIEYYMAYKDQPTVYLDSANSAFHEAVGEVVALSVTTDKHLKKVGLMKSGVNGAVDLHLKKKQDINSLMEKALLIVSFLPYAYILDKYRWDVFNGKITSENYNRAWWHMRLKYQGVVPPVKRSEKDFDAAAKYHVSLSVPYLRYFIAFILQFQFYEAICAHTNHTGPLHQCDFYGSKTAGDKLKSMMAMGKSRPWPDALEALTNQREMSARPLVKYFKPLMTWLKKENKGEDINWMRPEETVESVIDQYFN